MRVLFLFGPPGEQWAPNWRSADSGHKFRLDINYDREAAVPREMGAAQFKEKCLAILDSLEPEGIVITKHGKPVAKLVPIESASAELLGALAGTLTIHGDILSTGTTWDAES
jgi:prevent-host-death family protein